MTSNYQTKNNRVCTSTSACQHTNPIFFWDIQDRQCMYNATLRHICATTVVVEKQWLLHNLSVCIFNLRYPACNAHAPYCHLWPAPFYNIFLYFLINCTIFFKKKVTEHICVFWFCLQLLHVTFSILRRNEQGKIKNVYWSSCQEPLILVQF